MKMVRYSPRTGFTLIELMVVISILGILMTLLVSAVNGAREGARQTQCISNMKNISAALMTYSTATNYLPYSLETFPGGKGSWVISIMRQLDEGSVSDAWENNTAGLEKSRHVASLICPSNSRLTTPMHNVAPLSYYANCGYSGLQNDDGTKVAADCGAFVQYGTDKKRNLRSSFGRISSLDGASETILFSENNQASDWATPDNNIYRVGVLWFASPTDCQKFNHCYKVIDGGKAEYARPSSNHNGGANVTFCDHATKFINAGMDYITLCQLMAPADSKAASISGKSEMNNLLNTTAL